MKEFNEILEVADALFGPNGCPWDKKQTFETMRAYFIEEAHELVEAIDHGDEAHIIEELGDLFYTVVFFCEIAKRAGKFSLKEVLEGEKAKLVRRHPHVFGKEKEHDAAGVEIRWAAIKETEKSPKEKKFFERLPKSLPALIKAQKLLKIIKIKRPMDVKKSQGLTEEELGAALIELVRSAEACGLNAEAALNSALKKLPEID